MHHEQFFLFRSAAFLVSTLLAAFGLLLILFISPSLVQFVYYSSCLPLCLPFRIPEHAQHPVCPHALTLTFLAFGSTSV